MSPVKAQVKNFKWFCRRRETRHVQVLDDGKKLYNFTGKAETLLLRSHNLLF